MHIATFTLELKATARKDKTHALRIRITKFREHAYWNLGKYILKGELNPAPKPKLKNWVIKSDDAPQINYAIDKAFKGLEKISDKNPALTAAGIKEAYRLELNPEAEAGKTTGPDFLTFAAEYISRVADNNYKTGKGYGLQLKEFKAVVGEKPGSEVLTVGAIHKYHQALKKKGNAPKTIRNKFRMLSAIFNAWPGKAQTENPFAGIKVVVPKKKKERPTNKQIQAFLAYQPENEKQRIAKLVTMLQYFMQGARILEALTLEWANVHPLYIEYLPRKEAKKPKFVPRSETLNWLLEQLPKNSRYVLPLLSDKDANLSPAKFQNKIDRLTTMVNSGLKEIAEKLEIDLKLSSHMFRHAFADALIAAGANPHTAAALLGHSNPKTSEAYFKDLELGDISDMALSILNRHKIPGEG